MDLRDSIIVRGAAEPGTVQVLDMSRPDAASRAGVCPNGHTVNINGGIATAEGKMRLTASDNIPCPVCGANVSI